MQDLPLYNEAPLAVIERVAPRNATALCKACPLHSGCSTVCMKAEGDAGGVLLVGEYPGDQEDKKGRPFIGASGRFLRYTLNEYRVRKFALANAIGCKPGGAKPEPAHVAACRPYLAQTLREAQPRRVIAMGGTAALSLLGRSPPLLSVRRGYSYLYNEDISDTGAAIPVFLLTNPAFAMRNRFARRAFETDLRWALTADPPLPPWDAVAHVVESHADAVLACNELRAAGWFAFDTETVGVLYEEDFRVIALAACAPGSDDPFVWDEAALAGDALSPLVALLGDPSVGKCGQNLKFDAHATRCGLRVVTRNHAQDTRLQHRLLTANAYSKLEVICELVGMGGMKAEADEHLARATKAIQKARERSRKALPLLGLDPVIDAAVKRSNEPPKRYAFGLLPREVLLRYNGRDAVSTTRLGVHLGQRLAGQKELQRVWDRVVVGASAAIEQVEAWGVSASRENAETFRAHLRSEMDQVERRFAAYPDLNIASPDSVAKLLYETLGLPPQKETKGGKLSTDKEALSALLGAHPIVEDLMAWRKLDKLRGTYAEGVPDHIRRDGRIHPSIKIDGTETGRLSCEEPNLQNIPRPGTVIAKMARDMFVAPPGRLLLEADYSQLELRVATMLSQDPDMLAIWMAGLDYHQRTAELIAPTAWGIGANEVTSEHRSQAKSVNFGVIYGMLAETLAKRLGCTKAQAETLITAIKGKFRGLAKWCDEQLAMARRVGHVRTWWDGHPARRRPLWDVLSKENRKRSNAENAAINTPIQGTASDFCLASLVECVDWLQADAVPAKLVLTVHDSIMFEVEEDAVEEVAYGARRIMTQWPSAGVPLVVDFKIGKAWGSLKEYKLAA